LKIKQNFAPAQRRGRLGRPATALDTLVSVGQEEREQRGLERENEERERERERERVRVSEG